jgi:uncharacterized protein (TIGR03435 family)
MSRVLSWTAILLMAAVTSAAWAQNMPMLPGSASPSASADTKVPEFDVASVKENKGAGGMMRWMNTADGMSTINISLQSLIASAYGIKQDLISGGPGWVSSMGFDIEAKVDGPDVETLKKLTPSQRSLMLRPLLAERFHLKVHIETKTLPIYELVVAKGGPKLTPTTHEPPPDPNAKPGDPPKHGGRITMGPDFFTGQDLAVGSVASELGYIVQRTVIDKTGLTGKYDMSLKWTPEEKAMAAGSDSSDAGTDAAPSIFTAVQEQLGLKLVSSKGPVETLVIDHAEMPTEN